jgi:putative holliday junction resolvase
MSILAVDPGSKYIGVAVSDPTGTIAKPLRVIQHVSRLIDAAVLAELASSNQASLIVVGQSLNDQGLPSYEGRRAGRLAEALKLQTDIPLVFWDEAFSTQAARQSRISAGAPRHKRGGHLDDLAAAVLLQDYLDAHRAPG